MRELGEAKLAINNIYERAESRNKQNVKMHFLKNIVIPPQANKKNKNTNDNKVKQITSIEQNEQQLINSQAVVDNISTLQREINNSNLSIFNKKGSLLQVPEQSNAGSVSNQSTDNNSPSTKNDSNEPSQPSGQSISANNTNIQNYTYNMKLLYEKLFIIQNRVIDIQCKNSKNL